MVQLRPQTESDLLDISGVGRTKLDRYGERFLELLRAPH
jgi:superfamily II DNA helicase RecQ